MGAGVIQGGGDGGKRRRSHAKRKPMAEINVTPFVDVMLVLLIIFMVAAPLLTVGVPINLPETSANALPTEQEEPLAISITRDGIAILQDEEILLEELSAKLTAIAAEREGDKVFVRADRDTAYGDVAKIMAALNNAGFNNIGLVTDQAAPEPKN